MKKNIRTAIYGIAILLFAVFTACNNDSVEDTGRSTSQEPDVDEVEYKVTKATDYTIEEMADAVFGKEGANSDSETLQQREEFVKDAKEEEKEIQNEYGTNSGLTYTSYTYVYKSKDTEGKDIWLSAEVSWRWIAGIINLSPQNLILYEHYTILKDAEAPTKARNQIQLAVGNNLLIQPDYIGYGETKSKVHPYLNHDITATNSIDALSAGYKVWKEKTKNKKQLSDNWKMYVVGASQGGAAALSVHKYLDTHPDVANKWRFGYSYCCCGPYSPTTTMEEYYKAGTSSFPAGILLTVKSMTTSYPEKFSKWNETDFYSAKYNQIKDEINAMIDSKSYDTMDLHKKMREKLGKGTDETIYLKDMLSETVLDMNSELAKTFFQCLEKNDLTTGWTPTHEIRLYQSKGDDVVPYANAEKLKKAFPMMVKEEVLKPNTGHVDACTDFIKSLRKRKW